MPHEIKISEMEHPLFTKVQSWAKYTFFFSSTFDFLDFGFPYHNSVKHFYSNLGDFGETGVSEAEVENLNKKLWHIQPGSTLVKRKRFVSENVFSWDARCFMSAKINAMNKMLIIVQLVIGHTFSLSCWLGVMLVSTTWEEEEVIPIS